MSKQTVIASRLIKPQNPMPGVLRVLPNAHVCTCATDKRDHVLHSAAAQDMRRLKHHQLNCSTETLQITHVCAGCRSGITIFLTNSLFGYWPPNSSTSQVLLWGLSTTEAFCFRSIIESILLKRTLCELFVRFMLCCVRAYMLIPGRAASAKKESIKCNPLALQ